MERRLEIKTEPLLEEIRSWVRSIADLGGVTIKGLWGLRCIFNPDPDERKFIYYILVAQTHGQGACYYDGPEVSLERLVSLVGKGYNGEPTGNRYLDIALLDSVASTFGHVADETYVLKGVSRSKATERARIIVSEVVKLCEMIISGGRMMVCNVGVVSLLVKELLEKGFCVTASDMDDGLCGKRLFGRVLVEDGKKTLELVSKSHVAVVTGMTLATDTLGEILKVALSSGTRLVIFAETGSSLAPLYLRKGVDVVISEPFPFYIFNGDTQINVFRRNGK